jgi:hypothetical protein
MTLRIYADFNGLVRGPRNPERTAVVLDTFGSLCDLSNAGVILEEGLPLIGVDWSDEMEDLEGHGTAQFDDEHKWWVIEFDEQGVRYVPAGDRSTNDTFLCVTCRFEVEVATKAYGAAVEFGRLCPSCGGSLDLPLHPPQGR